MSIDLGHNTIAVRNEISGQSASRRAQHIFSNDKLIVADVQAFERELSELFRQVLNGWRRLLAYPVVTLSAGSASLSDLEREAIRQAVANVGARKVVFV